MKQILFNVDFHEIGMKEFGRIEENVDGENYYSIIEKILTRIFERRKTKNLNHIKFKIDGKEISSDIIREIPVALYLFKIKLEYLINIISIYINKSLENISNEYNQYIFIDNNFIDNFLSHKYYCRRVIEEWLLDFDLKITPGIYSKSYIETLNSYKKQGLQINYNRNNDKAIELKIIFLKQYFEDKKSELRELKSNNELISFTSHIDRINYLISLDNSIIIEYPIGKIINLIDSNPGEFHKNWKICKDNRERNSKKDNNQLSFVSDVENKSIKPVKPKGLKVKYKK